MTNLRARDIEPDVPEHYWQLIVRYLSRECSDTEKRQIEAKIKTDPEFARFYRQIMRMIAFGERPLWVDREGKWRELKAELLTQSHGKVLRMASRPKAIKFGSALTRVAAVLLLVAGLSYLFSRIFEPRSRSQAPAEFHVVKVARGTRQAITLSDGTRIFLDAGSELRIPEDYGNTRDVYLKGEGYFQVVHDRRRPFRVHACYALIRVVGTEFNVRAWGEAPAVIVTVRQGKVSFGSEKHPNAPKVLVTKGKQSVLTKRGVPSKPVSVNVDEVTSWMKSELHFRNAPLREVLAQIERWYDCKFVVDDSSLYGMHVTYHVRRTTIDEIMQSISVITNTDVYRSGKTIRLVARKNGKTRR